MRLFLRQIIPLELFMVLAVFSEDPSRGLKESKPRAK